MGSRGEVESGPDVPPVVPFSGILVLPVAFFDGPVLPEHDID